MEICLNERQTRERVAQLKRVEGCILCKANWKTKRLYMPPKAKTYITNADGDFLLCSWHEMFYKGAWGSKAEAREVIKNVIENRKFDLPFFEEDL